MRISSLSRTLSIPFFIMLAYFGFYGMYHHPDSHLYTLIPGIIGLVLIYFFHEPIDRAWWTNHPPTLDKKIKAWLSAYSPYYMNLDQDLRKRFEDRLSTFMHVKEYTLKEKKDFHLQEDIKALLSHEFIRLTLHREEFLMDGFKHFVLYHHPFASPDHQYLHTVEVNPEDEGVVILSKEHLVNGFNPALEFFNIGLYAAILCWLSEHPRMDYPDVSELTPESICELVDYDLDSIKKVTGLNHIGKVALLIYAYHEHLDRLKATLPKAHQSLQVIFQ